MSGQKLLQVDRLVVRFGEFAAVNGVSFDIGQAETVGLVGESGSGKSTIGNAILGLARITSGSVVFDGRDVTRASFPERRKLSEHLQVVFQDPFSSLNPSRSIAQTLAEPLLVHKKLRERQARGRIDEMLERVGLKASDADKYPAAFSGGQRQRIAIARALMLKPKLVICDEPVSGLDLSTQAQVLNLFQDLQAEFGLALLFISHDLAVINYMSHRVLVLRAGEVMEIGTARQIRDHPTHPYTRLLVKAAPIPEPARQTASRLRRLQESGSPGPGSDRPEGGPGLVASHGN